MATTRFPWDSLKAESLRIVCRDLGGPPGRRDEMMTFLSAVEEQGLQDALQLYVRSTPERKPDEPVVMTPPAVSLKRNKQPVVSDYNTRHRDKRVRISDPGPRRKAVRRRNADEPAIYGRSKAASSMGTSSKGKRTIFDGVVLPRYFSSAEKGKGKDKMEEAFVSNGAHPDSEEKVGEEEEEEEVDRVLEGAEDSRLESSLASSNKENEGISPGRASGDEAEPVPEDAGSSRHSQRVLENIVDVADEDMDAEGEMVAEHEHEQEMAVRQDAPAPALPDIVQPSIEIVIHTEQFVQPAVENGHAL